MRFSPQDQALRVLYDNCIFRSETRQDTHDQVEKELAEHKLQWKRGLADAAMFKRHLRQLHIYVLQYGAEVEVVPRPFDGFSLVHTSLSGGMEIETDGQRVHVAEGGSALLSPRNRVTLRWHPGTVQMILRVPHALMRDAIGMPLDTPLDLIPLMRLNAGDEQQWALLARSFLHALSQSDATSHQAPWLDHLEKHIALFLLTRQTVTPAPLQPATVSVSQGEAGDLPASADARIQRMLDYMERKLTAPLMLADLAQATGVSLRTLNALCHHHHGMSPMELLRAKRLDAARHHLLLHPGATVGDTAQAFGFGHVGRFSHYYAARFGELPSETSARAIAPQRSDAGFRI